MFDDDPDVSQIMATFEEATADTAAAVAGRAVLRLEALVANDNAIAALALAIILDLGLGRDPEPAKALTLYHRVHAMARDRAWRDYLKFQSLRLSLDLDDQEARAAADSALRNLCDEGDVRAQLFLGLRYIEAPPESENFRIGTQLLERCAALGILIAGATLARSAFRRRQFRQALGYWFRNIARLYLIVVDYKGDRLFLCRPNEHWTGFGVPRQPLRNP